MKSNSLLASFLMGIHLVVSSQTILDFEKYKKLVLNFHPVIKQASNKILIGNNEVIKAKGSLDPKFESDIIGKQLNDISYYNLSNTGLKIPTWFGIDFKAGYEVNTGNYISPEHATSGSGLWYAGIEVPIAQGLLFDERRATIKIAQIFQQNSENEKKLLINDLLLDAYGAYWQWFESYQKLTIAKEGLTFAQERFNGVKANASQGEVPAIDTVEAKIQLDNRKSDLTQAEYDYVNAKLVLNLFLWTDNFIPLELEDNTIPSIISSNFLNTDELKPRINDSISGNSPLILASFYKIEELKIEEKWKKEQLKPSIKLSYNPISKPIGNNPFQNFSASNYKFGFSAYVPLFLRKERGSLNQTKIKLENSHLDLKNKINEIRQKELQIKNDLIRLNELYSIQKIQVLQTKTLRDSEQKRFEIGESSLFLVNSREMTYLNYKAKLVELEAKLKITEAKWFWLFSELD